MDFLDNLGDWFRALQKQIDELREEIKQVKEELKVLSNEKKWGFCW